MRPIDQQLLTHRAAAMWKVRRREISVERHADNSTSHGGGRAQHVDSVILAVRSKSQHSFTLGGSTNMKMFRRAAMLAMGVSLALVTAAPAGAAPAPTTDDKSVHAVGAPLASAPAAACPVSGQRVKTSASDRVYLIDPQRYLNWMPLASYNGLWDNFNNIATFNNLFTECYSGFFTMNNAHLAKLPTSAAVYVWDSALSNGPAYRWITSPAIFAKYGFSSGKIRTQGSVGPIATEWPWNN
jgi:hypothetical protein